MRNSKFRCLSKTPSCAALHTNNSSLALTALAAALDQAACDWSRPQLNLEYSALIGRHKTNTASYWSAALSHMFPGHIDQSHSRSRGKAQGEEEWAPRKQICNVTPSLTCLCPAPGTGRQHETNYPWVHSFNLRYIYSKPPAFHT